MYNKIGTSLIFLFLFGCAGQENLLKKNTPRDIAIGAAGAEVIDKIKESFTPVYRLYLQPLELCSYSENIVTCNLIPCISDCTTTFTLKEFLEKSPKFASLQSISKFINANKEFCKKNEDFCVDQVFRYASGEIILVHD